MNKKQDSNLTTEQKFVLHEEGTEQPGTSPLNNEKRKGSYYCVGCGTKLFESKMTVVGSGTFELKNPILFSFLSTNQMLPSESEVNVWVNVLSVGILNSDIEFVSGEILMSLSALNCVVHMLPSLSLIIW